MGEHAIPSRNECRGQTLGARDAIVWVEEGQRPSGLTQWAEERHLVLRCTVEARSNETGKKGTVPPPSAPDWKAASDEIEALLARARDETLRDDVALAKKTLEHAEALVLAHPSLPNAVWLLDEVKRALTNISPTGQATGPKDASAHGFFRPTDTVWLNSVPSPASMYWTPRDDDATSDRNVETLTFREQQFPLHLRIERRGVELAAVWFRSATTVGHSMPWSASFAAPEFACTLHDFAQMGGAFCPRWVKVRKEYVSLCAFDQCGQETRLRDRTIPWWMWTLAGATVATGIVVAFASSGAFDAAPRETTLRPNGFLDR